MLMKEFRGGVLVMTGANSAVGLRSMPVRYLFSTRWMVIRWTSMARATRFTWPRRAPDVCAAQDSAGVDADHLPGVSIIEREYEASTSAATFVPCPHCGHRQWLRVRTVALGAR